MIIGTEFAQAMCIHAPVRSRAALYQCLSGNQDLYSQQRPAVFTSFRAAFRIIQSLGQMRPLFLVV